ncbi:MAG: AAA family ATPase [Candidatus Limnocylindria bacterium]
MSAPELDTITITDFRSIRGTLAVPLTAPVVLIHGTNGAGKSTVMSALELALTGQVAGVDQAEREHLVHRGAERGRVDLKTGDGMVRFDLVGNKIQGKPLLDRADARFFTERCYLAQRTLGRLLELYESPSVEGESALTLFVKELLGSTSSTHCSRVSIQSATSGGCSGSYRSTATPSANSRTTAGVSTPCGTNSARTRGASTSPAATCATGWQASTRRRRSSKTSMRRRAGSSTPRPTRRSWSSSERAAS